MYLLRHTSPTKFPRVSSLFAIPVQTRAPKHQYKHSISPTPHRKYSSSEENKKPPKLGPIATIKLVSKNSFEFVKSQYNDYDWIRLLVTLLIGMFLSSMYYWWRGCIDYLKYKYGKPTEAVESETAARFRSTKNVTLAEVVKSISNSKMPQDDVNRLPAINVARKVDKEFLSVFEGDEFQTVIVIGPKGCGKSTLVIKALKNKEPVVKIEGKSTMTVDDILGSIGEAGSEYMARKAITTCKHRGRKPIIICEYKMTGSSDEQKSTFKELVDTSKMWQHDKGLCRVVFVLSDATLSSTVSTDPTRWTSFWIGDFEIDEATEYLDRHKLPMKDIPTYLDRVGTRPTDLLNLVSAANKEQFILQREQEAREIITALRDDPIHSKEQVNLMHRVLKSRNVSQRIAWGILFPRMSIDEQKASLLDFLKNHHLYQLKDGEILFHSRIIERVAQQMEKDGELKHH